MSNARNLADLLDSTGDVKSDALDNVSGLPEAIDVDASAPADSLNVDSSGNVLVGDSGAMTVGSVSNTAGGIALSSQYDFVHIARNSTNPKLIIQDTSGGNGTFINLVNGTSQVGSIGVDVDGTNLMVNNGVVGLRFVESSNQIRPANGDTGGNRDNAINLGYAASRFKDLYLSGGVYLGGTGSANYLDDYEEGTWTPSFLNGTVTYGTRSGVYTKVGGLVQASFMVTWTAISGATAPRITLPFNATSSTNYRGSGALGFMKGVDFNTSVNASWITTANQGDVNLVLNYDNSTPSNGNINDWSSSGEIQGTIVYRTDS